jgi:hypothetical protein
LSRAALGGTDFIDWGQLGGDGTNLSSSESITTNLGASATVGTAGASLWRFDQGNSYGGNFGPGDKLLGTFFEPGPIIIDFASGQSRVGAQIQANLFGAFAGVIEVYNVLDQLLESYSVNGASNSDDDNSAIFIGVLRATADIDHVVFNVTGPADLDFSINQVDLSNQEDGNPAPEPASLALVGLALAGLVRSRRRKPD